MPNNNDKLLNALSDYIKDIKPYHTKLKAFNSEILLKDSFTVSIEEATTKQVGFQNIWTTNDAGLASLAIISSENDADRYFRIPPSIFGRFSLNATLDHNQLPHGDDPASGNLTDANADGRPDAEVPYTGQASWSHQVGSNTISVEYEVKAQSVTVTSASLTSGTYANGTFSYTYDQSFTIDTTQVSTYGLGPTIKIFLGDSEYVGAYSRTGDNFTITGLTGTFTSTATDVLNFPSAGPSTVVMFCQYAALKNIVRVRVYAVEDTGRYRVPNHQGSRIYVNDVLQLLGTHYTTGYNRGWIQFLDGYHPAPSDRLDFSLFMADKLFISYIEPFDYGVTRGFDEGAYDVLLFDSSAPDADKFTITINHSADGGHDPVDFYNSVPEYANKAPLKVLSVDVGSTTNGDVWVVRANGLWSFTVQQVSPTVGPVELAYFKSVFDNGKISFIIDRFWSDYTIDLDPTSYDDVVEKPNDLTDFQLNTNLLTEHGARVDPNYPDHQPIHIAPFGVIKRLSDSDIGRLPWYSVADLAIADTAIAVSPADLLNVPEPELLGNYWFVLDKVPRRGTYVELRIDENDQFNPRVAPNICESLSLSIFQVDGSGWDERTFQDCPTLSPIPHIILPPPVLQDFLTPTDTIDADSGVISVGLSDAVSLSDSTDSVGYSASVAETASLSDDWSATEGVTPTVYEWTASGLTQFASPPNGDQAHVGSFTIPSFSKIQIELWGGGGGGGKGGHLVPLSDSSYGGMTVMAYGSRIDGGLINWAPNPPIDSIAAWGGVAGQNELNGQGGGTTATNWTNTLTTGLLTTVSVVTGLTPNNMDDGGNNKVAHGTDGGDYSTGPTIQAGGYGGQAYLDSVGGAGNSTGVALNGTGYGAAGAGSGGSVSPFGLGGGGGGGGQYVKYTYFPGVMGQRSAILNPGMTFELYVGKGGAGQSGYPAAGGPGAAQAAGHGTPGRIRITVWP